MKKLILIIEDDEAVRHMLRSILVESGFSVETAKNGKIGLEKIIKCNPNLVLLDVLMPVMGGFDVLKELKTGEADKCPPVLVLTSLGQENNELMARSLERWILYEKTKFICRISLIKLIKCSSENYARRKNTIAVKE